MNRFIFAAAALSLLLTYAHIVHGGADHHLPVLGSQLPTSQKALYSIIWHFVSFALFINSIVLFFGAFKERYHLSVWLVVSQYLAFAGLFLFYGMTRLGSITVMPQWTFFLAISGLAFIGLARHRISR